MSRPETHRPEDREHGLATLFLRNRHLLVLTVIVLLVGGLSALVSLPRLEDPRIAHRNLTVVTAMPGATAERVEAQVTEVLEESLQEVAEITGIDSSSRAGVSVIAIELEAAVTDESNDEIFSEIRDAVAQATPSLPPEALPPVLDTKREPVAFTLILALRWQRDEPPALGLLDRLAEDLADRLRQVPGSELVRIYGQPEEEITITADPAELAELGLDAAALADRLALGNARGPAGLLRGERSDLVLEVAGELDGVARIADLPLAAAGHADATLVRLGDIAEVRRGWREPGRELALVDGDRSILVAARMARDVRIDRWARQAHQVTDAFAAELGGGVVLEPVFEQERYTTDRLATLGDNLLAGAVVVLAVVFLMMGWRSALVVGAALPLVVSVVFFGWQLGDGAIQQMSIFGLIIALGLLIDNAIVMTDEVSHHRAMGRSPLEAVDRAVRHLAGPLFASTLTTVLAFAPILLLEGSVGDFVGSIGSSVILAIVASFVLALTVTAGLAGLFARPTAQGEERRWWRDGVGSPRLTASARKLLGTGLRQPLIPLLIALFLPLSGFLAARSLGNEFFPPVDRDSFHLRMWLPTDSPLDHTRDRALAVESVLRELAPEARVEWLVGGSYPTVYYNLVMRQDDSPHYAQAVVTVASSRQAKALIAPLQAELDRRFADSQIVVRQFGQGPPIEADVELRLVGRRPEILQDLGERVRRVLQEHPEVLHTQVTMPRGEPKLRLAADEDEARLAGLALGQVADRLATTLEGAVGGRVIEDLEQLPVRVRLADAERGSLDDIASLPLALPGADWVSLAALGELELVPAAGGLTRVDGERANIVRGYTRNGALPIDVTNAVLARLESGGPLLPPGYRLELGGAIEQDAEAKGNLFTYVPVLLTLTVATLILAFRSVALALLLSGVAGLSVGLGLFSTWTIGFPVSFNTILGTLGLIGVALNDSIVVLAAIRADPQARAGDVDAIVDRVLGTTRHVLSTTLTTIGGFLPLLLFVGGDFWPSLAIVLAGGIAGASLLALLLVPAVYVMLTRRRARHTAAIHANSAKLALEGGAS